MEQKEAGQQKAQPADKRGEEPGDKNNPSRWQRTKDWFKRDKSFTDWCIALFTVVLSAAAIYQFIIMGGQLDVMRTDQRAWLKIESALLGPEDIKANAPIVVNIRWTNIGKTMAQEISSEFFVGINRSTQKMEFDYARQGVMKEIVGMLAPNNPMPFVIGHFLDRQMTQPVVLSGTDVQDLMQSRAYLFVYGRGTYSDIFGKKHWFTYCNWRGYALQQTGFFSTQECTQYENTGDGDLPPR